MQKPVNNAIERILFITLSNIGDIVLTTPVLTVLSERFPNAQIDIMVGPGGIEIFKGHPAVSNVIAYDKHTPISSKRRLVAEIRKTGYDFVVDLRNSLFPYLAKARYRTNPLRTPPKSIRHKKQQHLWKLTTAGIGIEVKDAPFYLYVSDADKEYAANLLRDLDRTRPIIAVSPGAKSDIKRWPWEYFSILIERLIEDGAQIVMVGDERDREVAEAVKKSVKKTACDISGKTTLRQLAAVLQICDLLITNDSAPLHIAGGVGTKVLAIFGPTDPKSYGPTGKFDRAIIKGLWCSPCGEAQCKYAHECMKQLGVEEVWSAAREMAHEKAGRYAS